MQVAWVPRSGPQCSGLLGAIWGGLGGPRQGLVGVSVSRMKPEPPESPGKATRWRGHCAQRVPPAPGCSSVVGTHRGFAELQRSRGLRCVPPPLHLAPSPTGSRPCCTLWRGARAEGDGALVFSALPLARSRPPLVLQCRLARRRANSSRGGKKGVPGGAGALQMLPSSPQQLATFLVFFPGDATPPEDTGDIGFC